MASDGRLQLDLLSGAGAARRNVPVWTGTRWTPAPMVTFDTTAPDLSPFWYDTDAEVLKAWDGTDWQIVGCCDIVDYSSAFQAVWTDHQASSIPKDITTSGVQEGDLLVAFADLIEDATLTTVPSGWTLVRVDANATGTGHGNHRAYIYTRLADSADTGTPTYTWDNGVNQTWTLTVAQFRGPTAVAADDNTVDTGSTTWVAPGVTAAGDGLLVVMYAAAANGGVISTPTGMTARAVNIGASGYTAQYLFDEPVTAGATGTRTSTAGASQAIHGQTLLLV